MNLGFYYHVPVYSSDKGIMTPAYQGLFLDELAKGIDKLTLFLHEANQQEISQCDYLLKGKNIRYFNLGLKTRAWDRFLFPGKYIKLIDEEIINCNFLLVRGPSPLAPYIYFRLKRKCIFGFLIVGDYRQGAKFIIQPWFRKYPIKVLLFLNDLQLKRALKSNLTLVNSHSLYERYRPSVNKLFEVRTTTLTSNDFYKREDTCQGQIINLLYSGRIDRAKGLIELLNATAILTRSGTNVNLYLVGWEEDSAKPFEIELKRLAERLRINDKVIFSGNKQVGEELNLMYRMADIYVIPSYHEGFPRTIWEAMANGLPVIASRVGSIPYFLTNKTNVLLVSPKNTLELVDSILEIISKPELRKNLIANGAELALNNTLEIQTKLILKVLYEELHNRDLIF